MEATKSSNPFFEPVSASYAFDDGPGRYRIGVVVPAEDAVTERDFRLMTPDDEIAVYISRVETTQLCSLSELAKMGPLLCKCASLIVPGDRLDVIAYSCTSGTIAIGYDKIVESFQTTDRRFHVVTPITAALEAFDRLGVKRIAVLTPYPDDVNQGICNFLKDGGADIRRFASFYLDTDYEVSRIPPSAIHEAAATLDGDDIDGIFISCTGVRAAETVEGLEHQLNKPVVTSNQAMFWQSIRLAGFDRAVPGFGRLLTHDIH